jgi:hypothetical protein
MRAVLVAWGVLAAGSAFGQSVVSARSGTIHYSEGDVRLNDNLVKRKFGQFPEVPESGVLSTERGRAEVLLTPGVFLRMKEDSSVRMLSNQLSDTRVELISGTVLVECAELMDNNSVTLLSNDAAITFRKNGLYRLSTEPAELRVFEGQVQVVQADQKITVKKGKMVSLGAELAAAKFDAKTKDGFYRWSSRRAGYLAAANVSAAKSLADWGYSWRTSGWQWNPYLGMITFVPSRGVYWSPFGYSFWSPSRVVYAYYQPRRGYGSGSTGGGSSAASSNTDFGRMAGGGFGRSGGAVSASPSPSIGAGGARGAAASTIQGGGGGRSR